MINVTDAKKVLMEINRLDIQHLIGRPYPLGRSNYLKKRAVLKNKLSKLVSKAADAKLGYLKK